jgi:hypothetical protein
MSSTATATSSNAVNPPCGMNQDNIYTGQGATKPNVFASPNANDSVLLLLD